MPTDNNGFLGSILSPTQFNPSASISRASLSSFKFNGPIIRSGDLRNQKVLQGQPGGQTFRPTFFIDPPTKSMNKHAKRLAKRLSKDLSKVDPVDGLGELVRRFDLEQLLQDVPSDSGIDGLLDGIQKSNEAGDLSNATKKIDAKTLAPTDRFLLSLPGIYHYVLFLLNQGLGMTDEDIIVGNVLPALQRVKKYLNVRIVEAVLKAKHLDDEFEKPIIQENLGNRNLPYDGNRIENIILDEFEKVSEGGPLLQDVINFLDSNDVPIPDELGRKKLIEGMVNFLRGVGIDDLPDVNTGTGSGGDNDTPTDDDGNDNPNNGGQTGGDTGGGNTPNIPPDNFENAIKGIGDSKADKLYAAGIKTFSQLGLMTETDLEDIISPQTGYTLQSYIDQARHISQGQFDELLALQEQLPFNSGITNDV